MDLDGPFLFSVVLFELAVSIAHCDQRGELTQPAYQTGVGVETVVLWTPFVRMSVAGNHNVLSPLKTSIYCVQSVVFLQRQSTTGPQTKMTTLLVATEELHTVSTPYGCMAIWDSVLDVSFLLVLFGVLETGIHLQKVNTWVSESNNNLFVITS